MKLSVRYGIRNLSVTGETGCKYYKIIIISFKSVPALTYSFEKHHRLKNISSWQQILNKYYIVRIILDF